MRVTVNSTAASDGYKREGFHTGACICNGCVSDAFGFRQGWSTWRNYIRGGRRTQARFVAADVLEWLDARPVPYTHLRAHETVLDLGCRLLRRQKKCKG